LGPERPFRYYGVDRARSMLELGRSFADAARARGGCHPDTKCDFVEDLDAIDFGPVRGDLSLVVASYLLASPSLDVTDLVRTVLEALDRIGPGPAAVLYTNSAIPTLNTKYPLFRRGLVGGGFEVQVESVEMFRATRNPRN